MIIIIALSLHDTLVLCLFHGSVVIVATTSPYLKLRVGGEIDPLGLVYWLTKDSSEIYCLYILAYSYLIHIHLMAYTYQYYILSVWCNLSS